MARDRPDRAAVKALVAVFGPREAARQAGLKEGTVCQWCRRYHWKKADRVALRKRMDALPGAGKDPAEALIEALQRFRDRSTLDLAQYVANAAKDAAKEKEPLGIARKVRDVAQVFSVVHPPEEGGEMIEGGILLGTARVAEATEEILANVRETLPDPGSQGD
jgi:hypothetical protein